MVDHSSASPLGGAETSSQKIHSQYRRWTAEENGRWIGIEGRRGSSERGKGAVRGKEVGGIDERKVWKQKRMDGITGRRVLKEDEGGRKKKGDCIRGRGGLRREGL